MMFDVDGFKFKAIASNIIHQTSNIKEKGTSHDGKNLRATAPFKWLGAGKNQPLRPPSAASSPIKGAFHHTSNTTKKLTQNA
ncbi:hypothetical protein [Megasphaera elsdenii]|uniref:hypothetical protein n=1 Tax=Megasphaera elsdenii TaxID=907 RepID=UPI0012FEDD4B|nr:hypothetical protein [Megasphaera elsdenii]